MSTYKKILLESLIDEDWELIEAFDCNHDWWCDEHWLIRSVRENWGIEVMIFFLVDPMWDTPRKKGQGIWAIAATDKFPERWGEAGSRIATLTLSKRRFNQKLVSFLSSLNHYRRNASR
ncbi:MAG: hypothetical protein AB1631_24985 [Acidobacteriota bacterium]